MKFINMSQLSQSNISKFNEWIFAFLLFFLIPPFFVWDTSINILAIFIISFLTLRYCNFKKDIFPIFIIMFLLYLYCISKGTYTFYGVIITLCCLIFLLKDDFLIRCINKFILIYSITLVPSIIIYSLINFANIDISYNILEPLNKLKVYVYYQYPFLIQDANIYDFLPRFHAYYDEPGVVGTISGLLLAINKLNKKKIVNIPILIAGVLSFSLAFYIVIIATGILFLKNKYKIVFLFFLVFLIFLFSNNDVTNHYLFNRVQIEDGNFVGNNRTSQGFESWYKDFKNTSSYYWGLGSNASSQYNYGGASYKDLIVNYGVIFFILFCVMFVVIGYQKLKWKKELLLALFLFFAILYQRPFITNYFYLFLLYCPFVYLKRDDFVDV